MCMRFWIFFSLFLILNVVNQLRDIEHHHTVTEEVTKEGEGESQTPLAPAQNRQSGSVSSCSLDALSRAPQTSFQGSPTAELHLRSTSERDDKKASLLEVLTLPCGDEGNLPTLLEVWVRMGQLYGRFVHPAGDQAVVRPELRTATSMERTVMEWERTGLWVKESKIASQVTIQSQPPSWRRQRLESWRGSSSRWQRLWKGWRPFWSSTGATPTHGPHDDAISTDAYDWDGERNWKGHASANGCSANHGPATTATGESSSWHNRNWPQGYVCVAGIYPDGALSNGTCNFIYHHFAGGSEGRRRGPEEAESPSAGDEEGGRFSFTQSPVYGTRDEEARRKEPYERPTCGPQIAWTSQGRALGSGKCEGSAPVAMENILATVCGKVERVHCQLSSLRHSPSRECTYSSLECQASSEVL